MEEGDLPAQSPDLYSIKHLWDECQPKPWARPYHLKSGLDLTNALGTEWERIPAAKSQKSLENFSRTMKAVIAAN